MKILLVAIALSLFCAAITTLASASDLDACDNTRNTAVQKSLDALGEVESWIELVPPDEASYLSKESGHSEARFKKMYKRPYYHAWNMHEEFEGARLELQALKDLPTSSGPKEKIKAASRVPYMIFLAMDAFSDYFDGQSDIAKELHKNGKYLEGYWLLLTAASDMGHYISCTADLIADK